MLPWCLSPNAYNYIMSLYAWLSLTQVASTFFRFWCPAKVASGLKYTAKLFIQTKVLSPRMQRDTQRIHSKWQTMDWAMSPSDKSYEKNTLTHVPYTGQTIVYSLRPYHMQNNKPSCPVRLSRRRSHAKWEAGKSLSDFRRPPHFLSRPHSYSYLELETVGSGELVKGMK